MGCSLRSGLLVLEPTLPRERDVDDERRRTVQIDRVTGVGLATHKRKLDRSVIGRDYHRPQIANHFLAQLELGPRLDRLAQAQAEQAAVGLAAVVEPGDRL